MFRVLRFLAVTVCAFLATAGVANAQIYTANLTPAQEVPAVASTATGYGRVVLDEGAGTISFTVVFNGLTSAQSLSHIHTGAIGASGPVTINFGTVGGTSGTISGTAAITAGQITTLRSGGFYINVHSVNFPNGEIRGQLGVARVMDYDGDGQTDYGVLRFANIAPPAQNPMTTYNLNSTTGLQAVQWGDANLDFPCPGDYDGDGKSDLCVYRNGATAGAPSWFYILPSSDSPARFVQWGTSGDQNVSSDYDGDGITDLAIFRRGASANAPAYWWIMQSRTNTVRSVQFGLSGDSMNLTSGDGPAPQDYDGDGKTDLAIYRWGSLSPANNFIVLRSSDSQISYFRFGDFNSDYIVPRDYDGDGKADYAIARTGSTATSPVVWWILQSANSQMRVSTFGFSSDAVTPGDYDGDGRVDISIARSGPNPTSPKTFWTHGSFANNTIATQWGIRTDFAVGTFNVF